MSPPIDPIIEVVVLRDCGELVEEGIKLDKHAGFYTRRSLV